MNIIAKINNINNLDINKLISRIKRHSIWIIFGGLGLIFMKPALPELKTIFFILIIESIALMLSGLSVHAFTEIDFIKEIYNENKNIQSNTLGFIFLAVHICIGLAVLGVYIAQFSN